MSEISPWKGTGSCSQIQGAYKECLGFWNELLSCSTGAKCDYVKV